MMSILNSFVFVGCDVLCVCFQVFCQSQLYPNPDLYPLIWAIIRIALFVCKLKTTLREGSDYIAHCLGSSATSNQLADY
jgi:hypothetical protein